MFKVKNPEETDLYNETMDFLGPKETDTGYSVWQAIPRDIGTTSKPRVMAGGRAIIRNYLEKSEHGNLEIALLQDGMPFFPGDPVIQVIGDKSAARKIEPKVLSTLYKMTAVASRTKDLVDNLGQDRVIDVSMRADSPGTWNYTTEAFLIGGGKLTATTAIRNLKEFEEGRDYTLVGTTGHSLYLEYAAAGYSQKEAFEEILNKFEENFEGKSCALLVDTVDPMLGINQAISVIKTQKQKTGQTHWIRLDSGDLYEQGKYALEKTLEEIPDFKVIIEDGLTLEAALEFDKKFEDVGLDPKKHILYGFGGSIVNNITRDGNGAWAYKPSQFRVGEKDIDTIKLSANQLKNSLPGLIGINYEIDNSRLVGQNSNLEIQNEILTDKKLNQYMEKSVGKLREDAKNFWNIAENQAPEKWHMTYDLDKELTNKREFAINNLLEFGNTK